jgi:peptide chain release factor 1
MRPSSADTSVPGEREAVDVVDEEQDVAALVAEALGHGEARERHAQAVARGLVHLAEHHRDLRLREVFLHDDLGFRHLVVEVVALAGALAHAGEHRQARVLRGDVVDELEHRHGLAHARAAEEADLAALGERADQVDNLDARLEQLHRGRELVELGRGGVDRAALVGVHRAALVDRAAEHVHHAPERGGADRHRDRAAGCSSPSCRGAGRRRSPSRWCARRRRRAAARPRT